MNIITKELATAILIKYHENEELNLHSENFLLLAQSFQDERAIDCAEKNLKYRDRSSNVSRQYYNVMAYESCNHLYYKLVKIAER
jgi:hypothetical protein